MVKMRSVVKRMRYDRLLIFPGVTGLDVDQPLFVFFRAQLRRLRYACPMLNRRRGGTDGRISRWNVLLLDACSFGGSLEGSL